MTKEVQSERLAQSWQMMQHVSHDAETVALFSKLSENQAEFVERLNSVHTQQELMKAISKCYEEGDWTRMQTLLKTLIEQYDKNGYAKRAAFLIEAGQQAIS